MSTYLLTWNSKRWQWENLRECVESVKKNGYFIDTWSAGNNKKIIPNDRLFMIRLGEEPRGIFASGWAVSSVYEDEHWDTDSTSKRDFSLYVEINFDVFLDPDKDTILNRSQLHQGILANMHWESQSSGVRIPDEVAIKLEIEWAKLLGKPPITNSIEILPQEIDENKYFEGAVKQINVNIYERNPIARARCINHYGLNCHICGFNFQKVYGDLGIGFIHVHHLKPLSELNSKYELNPIKDLRPVCPNCHAIIHKRKPPYSIEELKNIIKKH